MENSKVLILGGCGFIGRNLVSYLVTNKLANYIRVVDKVPPQIAWLNKKHQEDFNDPIVEFKSANLINQESCRKAFVPPDNLQWDYIINCAAETKLSQTDPIYHEGIFKLSVNCAKEAAAQRARHYVELSSGQMFSASDKKSHSENMICEPWTFQAKWKYRVETELNNIDNLQYTILRPALVYGLGDKQGIICRAIVASLYRQIGETMKLLWNSDLKLNTVHVDDLCRAIWFVCDKEDTIGQIYNIVDEADSTQGSITNILAEIFNIRADYYGSMLSSMVGDLSQAADEANDKHLQPWADACKKSAILNTPLSPHMDRELLLNRHLSLNGEKLRNLDFQLRVPYPTCDNIKDAILYYVDMRLFPAHLIE